MPGTGRILTAAGGASAASALLFALFEVMEWKMPQVVALSLAVILFVALAIFVVVALWEAVHFLRHHFSTAWGLRNPLFRRKADPNQWLMDRMAAERLNPTGHLYVQKAIVRNLDLTPTLPRPYVILEITVLNASLHVLKVEEPKGYPRLDGIELGDPVVSGDGYQNMPVDHVGPVRFRVIVPPDRTEAIQQERVRHGRLRCFGLGGVYVNVTADAPDAMTVKYSLGHITEFRFED